MSDEIFFQKSRDSNTHGMSTRIDISGFTQLVQIFGSTYVFTYDTNNEWIEIAKGSNYLFILKLFNYFFQLQKLLKNEIILNV